MANHAASKTLRVGLVLDMSGSMSVVHLPTVEGVNNYIQGLQEEATDEAPTFFSLTAFDTVFENWVVSAPVGLVAPISAEKYVPRGMTALYDAIADTVRKIETTIESPDEKVLIVVWTDGQENSSIEFSADNDGARRIAAFVSMYEARGNWTFIWMSAGHENLGATQSYAAAAGFSAGNVAHYTSDAASVARSADALQKVSSYRKGAATGQTVTAFDDAGESQELGSDGAETPEPNESTAEPAKEKNIGGLFGGN